MLTECTSNSHCYAERPACDPESSQCVGKYNFELYVRMFCKLWSKNKVKQ